MKKITTTLYVGLALFLFTSTFAIADVPKFLNYQGKLSNGSGPVTDGTYKMEFAVFKTLSGGTTAEWSETHDVEVTDGIYNVLLGSVDEKFNPFDLNEFTGIGPYYLEIRICPPADPGSCDPLTMEILSPRQELTSSAYAFKADEAAFASDADTLDGYDSASFIRQNQSSVISNVMIENNAVETSNIAQGAVTSLKIADRTIKGGLTGQIATETITGANLADGAVTAAKIAPGYVSGLDADLVDGQHAADIIDAASDEVRIPISSLPIRITAKGSYYLTENLNLDTTASFAIEIAARYVTIDFMGFKISGHGAGSSASGIGIAFSEKGITIKNGAIHNFSGHGILFNGVRSSRVENMQILDNGGYGIAECEAGIIKNNIISGNNEGGIDADESVIEGNNVFWNEGIGIAGTENRVKNNSVYKNDGIGIACYDACSIIENSVIENNRDDLEESAGIRICYDSVVKGNIVVDNLQTGILIPLYKPGSYSNNCIEGNHVKMKRAGEFGIKIVEPGNLYLNNRVTGPVGSVGAVSISSGSTDGGGNILY